MKKIKSIARALGLGRSYQSIHKSGWQEANAGPVDPTAQLSAQDILTFLKAAGLQPGDTLWLQSNWNVLSAHKIDPIALIQTILKWVGPEGHVMMPAFLDGRDKQKRPVDFGALPSATGLLTELFRRWPGVERSVDLDTSVSIWGAQAKAISARAHKVENPWSPEGTMAFLNSQNAMAVSLGFGRSPACLSPMHLLEGLYGDRFRGSPIFDEADTTTYEWVDPSGQTGRRRVFHRRGVVNMKIMDHFIPEDRYHAKDIENGRLIAMRTQDLLRIGEELLDKSITHYNRSLLGARLRYAMKRAQHHI